MSACIVRATGELANYPASLIKLKQFLQLSAIPKIVVVSSLPEISGLLANSIGKVFFNSAESESAYDQLIKIWNKNIGAEPSAEYLLQVDGISKLLKGIYLTGDYSPALKDQVMSYSEILSAHILVQKLKSTGCNCAVILPDVLDLKVTEDYGIATFISFSVAKARSLDPETIYFLPGSWGMTNAGKIARAGRSAADYTASFLAAGLNAERLVLWGSGKEFYATDRAIVAEAEKIGRLTYEEASELAYFDHYSLHPRAVEPLIEKHIPIHLININSINFEPDTIINSENFVSDRIVKCVAYSDDLSILRLNGPGVGLKPGILGRITSKLSQSAINIKSVITSQVSINILLDRKSGTEAVKVARELGFTAVSQIELLEEVSLVAIVGHGMQQNYGISARLFSALAENKINVMLSGSGASDLVSYLVVDLVNRDDTVKSIYHAFFSQQQ